MRKAVLRALEIRDEADIIRGLDRGELEARTLEGERARATAPPDVTGQLRLTAQAEADALQQSADAQVQHDDTGAASATALAAQLAAERQRLEAGNVRYEQWSADTHATREAAGKARAELQRRGHVQPDGEPLTTAGWWRESGADLQAAERAIARQHQAAIDAGAAWPPQRAAEPAPNTSPEAEPVSCAAPAGRPGSAARRAAGAAGDPRSASQHIKPNGRPAANTPHGSSAKPRPSPKPNIKPKPEKESRSRCKDAALARYRGPDQDHSPE